MTGYHPTFSKNVLELILTDDEPNKLIIQTTQNSGNIRHVVNVGDDTIIGVGSGSTNATELRDALEPIFFLVNDSPAQVLSFPIDVYTSVLTFDDPPIEITTTSYELVNETIYNVPNDGTYIIDITFSYNYRVTNNDGFFRFDFDDVQGIELNLEQKDRNNIQTITSFAVVNWTAGSHSIKFYARKESGAGGNLEVRRYLNKISRGKDNV